MNNNLKHKIDANDTCIKALLKDQKFYIDYFQREYRWKEKHITLLIEDLCSTFLKSYKPSHNREEIVNYQSYYLGPVVFSINDGKKSIIDGQQRITSITLLLIYLNHLQNTLNNKVSITELIFSEKYGKKSFNMTDDLREPCLKSLFEDNHYNIQLNDDETVKNMYERYDDIRQSFPDELRGEALPYFIDWFIENVVIVEIIAYSDENAYIIFETMNDRGLNLTPTEMLKGYVLSKITNSDKRIEINNIWKKQIQKLHSIGEVVDQDFFRAWFRSKYAESIRPGKAGSQDKDFELIASRFHNWFKENHKVKFELKSSDDFYNFFKNVFPFYVNIYFKCWKEQKVLNPELPHLFYIKYWGIADSLQFPILLSSINFDDDDCIINKKLDFTSRYIETFRTKRAINYKNSGQTTIKYTMFNLIKLIRNNDLTDLGKNLSSEIINLDHKWNGIQEFGLHQQNGKFVKHLLCRISSYIDGLAGKGDDYSNYQEPKGKPFEIEHIWADKFNEHLNEFQQENEFQIWRNKIGALILLPNGTNQSFNSDKYEDKIEHYIKENTYAQTLHQNCYQKNPNFLKNLLLQNLKFEYHKEFNKYDISKRQELVQRICEQIWTIDYFNSI